MAKKKTKKVVSKKKATKKKAWKSVDVTGKKVDDKIMKLIAKKVAYYRDIPAGNYHGCGNGFIVVDKYTGRVERMEYTENGKVINEQNIFMSDEAGTILQDKGDTLKIRANFSCHTACLF
jgi:hypothetical protein